MKSKLLWSLVTVLAGLVAMPVQAAGEGQSTGQPMGTQQAPAAGGQAGQAAEGQAAEETKAPAFADVDKDRSGDISREEAKDISGLEDQWTTLDANKDDRLNESEFAAFEVKEEGGVMEKLKKMVE